MKKIEKRIPTPTYNFSAFISILFFQIFLFFVLIQILLFFNFKEINYFVWDILILLAIIVYSFFNIRAILVALLYFFAKEVCYCDDGKFFYKKFLFNSIKIKELSIPVEEIINISDRGKRIIEGRDNKSYIKYFKPNERIEIELKDKKVYKIWNYVKRPNIISLDNRLDKDEDFFSDFIKIKNIVQDEKKRKILYNEIKKIEKNYSLNLIKRYDFIINKIIEEQKVFIKLEDKKFIVNSGVIAIKNLENLKNMKFEEIDFYIFYVNYLSKKEYEDKKVLVGYNGIDGKEVTMLKLKEDINEIRDSRSTFKNQ